MFVSTNNTNIIPIQNNNNETNHTTTNTRQTALPNSNTITDLDEAYKNQQRIKRTGAEINQIIQSFIKEKKSKTTQALSKMS